ncbi:MAG TPA: LapA family protein [Ilumatobacteraceae bacterium]
MSDRDELDNAGNERGGNGGHIFRFVIIAVVVAALVIVAMDNRRDVRIGYAFGDANAPVWIVLVAAALGGIVIGWLVRHRPHHRI